MALELLRRDPATAWVFAVPSVSVKHKQCDQVPEEFRRAGIGYCMSGEDSLSSLWLNQSKAKKAIKMHKVIMRTVPFLLIMLN